MPVCSMLSIDPEDFKFKFCNAAHRDGDSVAAEFSVSSFPDRTPVDCRNSQRGKRLVNPKPAEGDVTKLRGIKFNLERAQRRMQCRQILREIHITKHSGSHCQPATFNLQSF